MTLPILCIAAAWGIALASKLPLSLAMRRAGGYDNKNPRPQQDQLLGWGARARAAHYNSLEAFPPFAIAVLVAHLTGVDARRATILCLAFLAARIAYVAAYLANLDYLRSALWFAGVGATAALMLLGLAQ